MPDIHDRLIARLEKLRRDYTHPVYGAIEPLLRSLIDMAIYAVRAKCPKCDDAGIMRTSNYPAYRPIEEACPCNRPVLLAEWERALNGGK